MKQILINKLSETAKGRNQMTDIQLLKVTELLNQYGNLIVKTEHTKVDFLIRLTGDRWIQITHMETSAGI
jgi:hypothetical protein